MTVMQNGNSSENLYKKNVDKVKSSFKELT